MHDPPNEGYLTAEEALAYEAKPGEQTAAEAFADPDSEVSRQTKAMASTITKATGAAAMLAQSQKANRMIGPAGFLSILPAQAAMDAVMGRSAMEPIRRMNELHEQMHMMFAPLRMMAAAASVASRERARPRGCERRQRPRERRHASRRAAGVRSGSDPGDDGPGEPPPPLRFWRHARFGDCTPNLLRILLDVEAGI